MVGVGAFGRREIRFKILRLSCLGERGALCPSINMGERFLPIGCWALSGVWGRFDVRYIDHAGPNCNAVTLVLWSPAIMIDAYRSFPLSF